VKTTTAVPIAAFAPGDMPPVWIRGGLFAGKPEELVYALVVSEDADVAADPPLVIVVVIGAYVMPELTYVTVSVESGGAGEILTTEMLEDVVAAAGAGSAVVLVDEVVCIYVSRIFAKTVPCTHARRGVWSEDCTLSKGADKGDVCCDGDGDDYVGRDIEDGRRGTVVDSRREGIAIGINCGNGLYVFEGRC
jgi:hypothetical protein